jgi:hypothetical protein
LFVVEALVPSADFFGIVGRLCQTPDSLGVESKWVWPVIWMFHRAGAHRIFGGGYSNFSERD